MIRREGVAPKWIE
jgi:hypothetical protein